MALTFIAAIYTKAVAWVTSSKAAILVTNKYIFAALILFISIVLGKLFLFIIEKIVLALTRKTKTRLDDLIVEKTRGPLFYIIILVGIYLSLSTLSLGGTVASTTNKIIGSLIIFIFAMAFNRSIDAIIGTVGKKWAEKTESTIDDELLPLFSKVSVALVFTFAFILILKVWEIDITGVLAGLGVVGIALGLAFQDSLKNIFGGIFLILDKNIKMGDVIKIDSGEIGEVTDIGLRSTRLKTPDNEMIIIPNGNLATSKIQNLVLPDNKLRINVRFSAAYGTDIGKVEKVVLEAISGIDGKLDDPAPRVVFTEMGDFSLNFIGRFWIDHYKNAEITKSIASRKIYEALNKAGIEIPFPARQVYIKKE